MAQKIKVVARETCHSTGGRGKEKAKGPGGVGVGAWKGIQARERASSCLLSGLAWKVWMESWRGRCTQLTASWASTQEVRLPCPLMLPIFLRFKKGNVLFISHRPVETWQPLDGSDPAGILVTSGCLLLPLNCGCSNSKRLKVTGSKRRKKILFFLSSVAFMRMLDF